MWQVAVGAEAVQWPAMALCHGMSELGPTRRQGSYQHQAREDTVRAANGNFGRPPHFSDSIKAKKCFYVFEMFYFCLMMLAIFNKVLF